MYSSSMDALLMEQALEMILGFDENGIILYANPAARSTLGYQQELVGMKLRTIVHPCARRRPIAFSPDLKKEKALLCRKDGKKIKVKMRFLEAQEEETISFLLAMQIMY